MPGVVPQVSDVSVLGLLNGTQASSGLTIHLFQNDFNPDVSAGLSQFIESSYSGYAAMGPACWLPVAIRNDGKAVLVSTVQNPTVTADGPAQTVFGYYTVAMVGSTPLLISAERFSEPKLMQLLGDTFALIVTISAVNDPNP